MLEQHSSQKYIVDCLLVQYEIKLDELNHLSLGADLNASVYQGKAQNGKTYFIKQKNGVHNDINCDVIALLENAGIQQVIAPIKNIQGNAISHVGDVSIIVYPFVEGRNGFQRNLTAEQWVTLGRVMRMLHEITVPTEIEHKIRRETFSAKWREMVNSLYVHIETEEVTDEIAKILIQFMKTHSRIIHRLLDRAAQLAKQIQSQLPEFVLCHADIHGGNVLITNDESIYIVDWDDPVMAPKERDLMFIGGGVANVWNKPDEETMFYQGYGNVEINQERLAYYRCERIIADIAEIGRHILIDSANDDERNISLQHFIAQFEPNGVVDIAFKTDQS